MRHPRFLLLLATMLAACARIAAPAADPDLRGAITNVQKGAVLVEGETNKAHVRITGDTIIESADGAPLAADALTVGTRVAVWFTGPVAESYPLQATGARIRVEGR